MRLAKKFENAKDRRSYMLNKLKVKKSKNIKIHPGTLSKKLSRNSVPESFQRHDQKNHVKRGNLQVFDIWDNNL